MHRKRLQKIYCSFKGFRRPAQVCRRIVRRYAEEMMPLKERTREEMGRDWIYEMGGRGDILKDKID